MVPHHLSSLPFKLQLLVCRIFGIRIPTPLLNSKNPTEQTLKAPKSQVGLLHDARAKSGRIFGLPHIMTVTVVLSRDEGPDSLIKQPMSSFSDPVLTGPPAPFWLNAERENL